MPAVLGALRPRPSRAWCGDPPGGPAQAPLRPQPWRLSCFLRPSPLRRGRGVSRKPDPGVLARDWLPLSPNFRPGFPEGPKPSSPSCHFQHSQGPRCQTPGLGVGCDSVPSSPTRREGLGEEWSHSWLLSGPGGGVGLSWQWRSSLGGTVCLPTRCTQPRVSWSWGGPSWYWPLGEGLDLCPQRPQGKGGRGPGARRLQVWSKMPLRLVPSAPPRLPGVSAHCHPPSFHPRQAPSRALCLCLGALIAALACPYLCLGPQSTWPPGLCPAGSQAAGSAASAAGSCSLPSAGPGPPGPDLRGWLGGWVAASPFP